MPTGTAGDARDLHPPDRPPPVTPTPPAPAPPREHIPTPKHATDPAEPTNLSGSRAEGDMPSNSYADTVERLFTEFDGQVPLPVITAMVHECRKQLCSSPKTAIPNLLEPPARQPLTPTAPPAPAGQ